MQDAEKAWRVTAEQVGPMVSDHRTIGPSPGDWSQIWSLCQSSPLINPMRKLCFEVVSLQVMQAPEDVEEDDFRMLFEQMERLKLKSTTDARRDT